MNPFKKHGLSRISLMLFFLLVRDKEIISLPSQSHICVVLCMKAVPAVKIGLNNKILGK